MKSELQSRILIVDDNISELEALKHILQPYYTIYFAKSGKSAIQRAVETMPDLILLDIIMPDMSGFEVLSELKISEATRDIPVIFITGLDSVEDEERGFFLGAVDYINKPFNGAIVRARINSHLNISKQIRTKEDASFLVKTRKEVRNVLFRELLYVEKSGHWLNLYLTNDRKITVYATLKEYDEILLTDSRFEHCHKSFIVNMDFVTSVGVRNVFMGNDICLPISKKYMDFKKHYIAWVSNK